MDDKTLVRKGRVKLFLSVLALGVITVAEVVAFLVVMFLNIPYESPLDGRHHRVSGSGGSDGLRSAAGRKEPGLCLP